MIARSALGKLLVFAVFVIGIATGVFSASVYRNRIAGTLAVTPAPNRADDRLNPQDRSRRDQNRFADYLGLDESQRAQIQKILDGTRSEFRQLREKVDPQFRAIEEGSRAKVRAVLTEEQRKKYEDFQKAHPRGDRGRGPRPPGNKKAEKP